jgi:hypothetical protein
MSSLADLQIDLEQRRWGPIALTFYCHSGWSMFSFLAVHFAGSLLILDFQNSRRTQEGRQNS